LFTVCAILAQNTGLSDFEINYKADVLGRHTQKFAAIDIGLHSGLIQGSIVNPHKSNPLVQKNFSKDYAVRNENNSIVHFFIVLVCN